MQFKQLCICAFAIMSGILPHYATAENKAPFHFLSNTGQVVDQYHQARPDIDFSLHANQGLNIFVNNGALHYQWNKANYSTTQPTFSIPGIEPPTYPSSVDMYRMDVQLVGSDINSQASTEGIVNYTEYHQLANGQQAIASAAKKITYKNVYPHIDWVLYIDDNTLEYDFIVHPGGKVSDIKLRYNGTTSLAINTNGYFTAVSPLGSITEQAPQSFDQNGKPIASKFRLQGNTLMFEVADYEGTLRIDPTIDWGTYYGGSLYDVVNQVVADDSGNVYLAGGTASVANIATTGAHQTTYGGGTGAASYIGDAFLSKFNSSGQCLWTTYFGGTGMDYGFSVAIDTSNKIYLAGFTNSANAIATTGSQQSTIGGGFDLFLAQFNVAGVLQWGTYYGGSGNENAAPPSVACDTFGNVYLSGGTTSTNAIATTAAHQTTIGGANDAFLAKFNSSGSLQWSTYYGGAGAEVNYGLICDQPGNIYICGQTPSTSSIATTSSHQDVYAGGQVDAYLVKFNSSGVRQWGTYFGGATYDRAGSVYTDTSGAIYMTGVTNSTSGVATTGAHQTTHGGNDDAFLVKFNSSGVRQWGTYYGGTAADVSGITGLSSDISGDIYLTGRTQSAAGIASAGSMQPVSAGSIEAFLAKFTPAGTRLWGTYIGGADGDYALSTTADPNGYVYVAGETFSGGGIATTGAHQSTYAGGHRDGFLIKITDCDTIPTPSAISGNTIVCKGNTETYTVPAIPGVTSYTWTLPTGWAGNSQTNSITTVVGTGSGSITVTANSPCTTSVLQTLNLAVQLVATTTPSGTQTICADDSVVLKANTGTGYSYTWLKDGNLLTGAQDDSLVINIAGYYSVIIDDGTCTDTSIADTLVVNSVPVPVITQTGTDLSTGSYVSYQWNFEGQPIVGAVNQMLGSPIDGHYTVTVVDANGCTGSSSVFTVGFPTSVQHIASDVLWFYPNPAQTKVHVAGIMIETISIYGLDGKLLLSSNKQQVDVSILANGIYTIQATLKDGTNNQEKLVITR